VGNYLKLSKGKGGYHTVRLYLDCFSQSVWGDKWKTHSSAATRISTLKRISDTYIPPETFMTDGGLHFNNKEVKEWCSGRNVKYHKIAEYSPWINRLVEGTNKFLLHVLKRLCTLELGEDTEEFKNMDWGKLPQSWPDHFDEAIQILNWRILPALKFCPKELLLGIPINTVPTPIEESSSILKTDNVNVHMAYAEQHWLDGYHHTLEHAVKQKSAFDRRVTRAGGEITFRKGQLVQIFQSDLKFTLKAEKKLTLMWSEPKRVTKKLGTSYKLETMDGVPLKGLFSSERLRPFVTNSGTWLDKVQQAIEQSGPKVERQSRSEKSEDGNEAEDGSGEVLTDDDVAEGNDGSNREDDDDNDDHDEEAEATWTLLFLEGGRCDSEKRSYNYISRLDSK
jgi:transposase InsO family protein